MCPYKSPNRPEDLLMCDDMSLDVFKQILDRFDSALEIGLTGGDPFLHDDIFEMINYAHHKKMKVRIPTNGIFLHNRIEQIASSSISYLNISLNAHNNKEFAQQCGASKQDYDRLLEDIRELVEKRNRYHTSLRLSISYICTKSNFQNIPKMAELAENLGVDELNFLNLIPYGIEGFLEDMCLYDDELDVLNLIRSVSRAKSNLTIYMPKLYKRIGYKRKCVMPFRTLSIDSDGNISPCCQIAPKTVWGNVFQQADVWNNSTMKEKRNVFIDKSLPLPIFCKTCHSMVPKRTVLKGHRKINH
jgi:radical SAM protein with 4Fe4S-binding SPASM domain